MTAVQTSIKYNQKLGNELCNVVFTHDSVNPELMYYLNSLGNTETRKYYDYAQWTYDVSDTNPIGLQVYRDYYLCVALVYMGKNGEYYTTGIGNIMNKDTDDMYIHNLPNYVNLPQDRFETAHKELVNLLRGQTNIVHDYDLEQINEAIACGDFELVEDILGDRDLTEFI